MKIEGLAVRVSCKNMRNHSNEVVFALQELKKKIKKDGLMQELRKREYYLSPSKKRRAKRNDSIKQRKRDERKAEWYKKTHSV